MNINMEKEEGEMSDDGEIMEIDTLDNLDENTSNLHTTEGAFPVVQPDIKPQGSSDEFEAIQVKERAKLLGLALENEIQDIDIKINEIHSLLLDEDGNERHIRYDTVHLQGTEGLTTNEVFECLETYKPISLEWVTPSSCNVVFQDHLTAILILLLHSENIEISNNEAANTILSNLTMRFATRSDKKDWSTHTQKRNSNSRYTAKIMGRPSKNPWGDLCMTWGIHDQQEFYAPRLKSKNYTISENGIVKNKPYQFDVRDLKKIPLKRRLGIRLQDNNLSEEASTSDDEWRKKRKAPRMRMHADDEEFQINPRENKKIESKLYKESITIEVNNVVRNQDVRSRLGQNQNSQKSKFSRSEVPIRNRLGHRTASSDSESTSSSDEDSSNSSESEDSIPKQRMSSVWQRLEKPNKENRSTTMKSTVTDLRNVINRGNRGDVLRRSPLRIEIDNDYYSESD